jgi:polysaccharide export outer membrane protein
MKQHREILLAGLMALALLTGCKTGPTFDAHAATQARLAALTNLTTLAVTNTPDTNLLQSPSDEFTLGPADRLEIEIVGDPTSLTTVVVGPDGKIYFNLLPGLDVWGLTVRDTRDLIEKELSKFIRQTPKVSVTLRGVESSHIWLMGRLNTPGVYPMAAPMTLLEALTIAGGPVSPLSSALSPSGMMGVSFSEDMADLRRSFVVRHGQVLPVDFYRLLKQGDMAQNIYLHPDDMVYVPSAMTREVYVLGAVFQSKAVFYRERMSLVSAVASAQGTIKDAFLNHVAILRGSLTEPKIAVVDYGAVIAGKSPDVLLEPGDIVYVPFVPYRTLERYANLILDTFVSTVAINEGARAVSANALPVGVSIPATTTH